MAAARGRLGKLVLGALAGVRGRLEGPPLHLGLDANTYNTGALPAVLVYAVRRIHGRKDRRAVGLDHALTEAAVAVAGTVNVRAAYEVTTRT